MTTVNYNVQNEGTSTSKPPFFDENCYIYWKVRMVIYIQYIDYDLWLFIKNGPHKPTKIENDIMIHIPRTEYTDNDKKLFSMDAKAMNTLYCALSISEFNRMSS
jgi:hypothetical protein